MITGQISAKTQPHKSIGMRDRLAANVASKAPYNCRDASASWAPARPFPAIRHQPPQASLQQPPPRPAPLHYPFYPPILCPAGPAARLIRGILVTSPF